MTSAHSASAANILPPSLEKCAPYLALVLAVVVAYGNVYGNSFVCDDKLLIVGNAFLRSWHFLGAIFTTPAFAGANIESHYYRPLQIFIYLVIYQVAGLSPAAFHVPNIVLHAADACLVYGLGRKLGFNPWAVFLATLIWASHPIHTEIITQINGMDDPLYAFFCLAALLVLLPDFAPRRICMAIPLLILGLLAKEETIIFPLLAMSCLFFVSAERYSLKTYIRTWPLWLIVGAYIVAHTVLTMQPGGEKVSAAALHTQKVFGLYLAPPPYTCLAALAEYLKLLVVPTHLHFDRTFPYLSSPWHAEVIAGFAIFLLAFYQVFWRQERRNLPLSWGILWFAAAYFLHSGIPLTFDRPVVEHFMYLPSAGLFLGLAETASIILARGKAQKFREINIVAALVIAFSFGLQTYHQNRVWHDPETLYLNIFNNGEVDPKAHNNLGAFYEERGDYARALEQYRLAIQLSDDTIAEARGHLAMAIVNQPGGDAHIAEAIRHLQRALEINPDYYYANDELAGLYDRSGDTAHAALYRDKAEAIRKNLTRNAQ